MVSVLRSRARCWRLDSNGIAIKRPVRSWRGFHGESSGRPRMRWTAQRRIADRASSSGARAEVEPACRNSPARDFKSRYCNKRQQQANAHSLLVNGLPAARCGRLWLIVVPIVPKVCRGVRGKTPMSLEEQIAQTVDPTLFTRLCNTLLTAQHGHAYQVIDGTRGDEGNDGWLDSERRIFAIYCPLKPERRKDADYVDKARGDLRKAAQLRDAKRYPVERWTFVTPRKLSNDVIVAIRKHGEELGLKVNHVEATYLSGLMLKHPELVEDFPEYHVSQIEDLLNKALESQEVRQPKPSRAPEHDIFSYVAVKKAAVKDEALREVIALRDS